MKAEKIKDLAGFTGSASLYKLDPPDGDVEFVVVSATYAMFSGPETYIFAADENGEVTNWLDRDGSYRGGLDMEQALKNAGYEVA